jgi:hypothetical protein
LADRRFGLYSAAVANYPAIIHMRPEVREFVRNRVWSYRGEAVTYGPNIRSSAFSTDAAGFRHSTFNGETLSVRECLLRDRYGLVLGPSNVYGFGLKGNENTLPSLLAERFGFPFANVGMPEGNSRNLFSLMLAYFARAPRKPAVVLHLSGGDFTSFCYSGLADPVFGPPNLKQVNVVLEERGGRPKSPEIKPLLNFTSLWIRSIGELCKARSVPLVLGEDTTFFEKAAPTEGDMKAELGRPLNDVQAWQFNAHKKWVRDYHQRRQEMAKALGVPLAGPGFDNDIGFIDEFHYDRDGTVAFARYFGDAIEPLLG